MRITILMVVLAMLAGCSKDKFTSVPQIKFVSVKPNPFVFGASTDNTIPRLTIHLTDSEGDFGFRAGKDTSYVYVKNITVPPFKSDSLKFPDLTNAKRANLDADVEVIIKQLMVESSRPRPKIDTLYFEVYVRDFANNKSNVIQGGPVNYIVQ